MMSGSTLSLGIFVVNILLAAIPSGVYMFASRKSLAFEDFLMCTVIFIAMVVTMANLGFDARLSVLMRSP